MTIEEKTVCTCKCNKCQYEWQARTEKIPKACPNCKSMKWNEVKKEKGGGTILDGDVVTFTGNNLEFTMKEYKYDRMAKERK